MSFYMLKGWLWGNKILYGVKKNETNLKVKRWIWNVKFSEHKEYSEVWRSGMSDGKLNELLKGNSDEVLMVRHTVQVFQWLRMPSDWLWVIVNLCIVWQLLKGVYGVMDDTSSDTWHDNKGRCWSQGLMGCRAISMHWTAGILWFWCSVMAIFSTTTKRVLIIAELHNMPQCAIVVP